jgi:flagellar basal-body rod protein FlgB
LVNQTRGKFCPAEEAAVRLDEIPLFATLKGRLGYLDARQKVIAQNVANADTPGFVPRDIKPPTGPTFAQTLNGARPPAGVMAVTQAGHITPGGHGGAVAGGGAGWKADKAPDSETRLDGNSVVLEEQMLKMAESRMAYDAAITFYQKSLNLLRLASKGPR